MKRRAFLGLLAAGAAGFALDPELALWVPGKKTYFLPSISDDTKYLQALIDKAAAEGIVIQLPAKTYLVSRPLVCPADMRFTIVGASHPERTVIRASQNAGMPLFEFTKIFQHGFAMQGRL